MRKSSFSSVIEYLQEHNISSVANNYIPYASKTLDVNFLSYLRNEYDIIFDEFLIVEYEHQIWGVIQNREILLFVWGGIK